MKFLSWLRLSIAIALLAVVCVGGFNNEVEAVTPPDSCFAFNAGTGTITNYYAHEANNPANPACTRDVDIPSTIGGVGVTAIGAAANSWNAAAATSFANKALTSVTIPSSVTSIGNDAFTRNQLTTVTIPNGVTNIGSNAFSLNQLMSVSIPNSITTIGTGAFSNNQLTSVNVPSSVTIINHSVFYNNQLTSVTIPHGVTSIGAMAFSNNQLTSVTIPSSVTSIGNQAFELNRLTTITIPSGVTAINQYAFAFNQLTSVNIPSTVTSIGYEAFFHNRLTSVIIPDSVTSIDPTAFAVQSEWGGDMYEGTNGAPDLRASDPEEIQEAYDAIWYVRLYTEDPSNPRGLVNSVMDEDLWGGVDANPNGLKDYLGGHLINPASANLKYVNATNAALQSSQIFTGMLNGSYLNNYMVTQGPSVPMPADLWNPTPTEQAAIDEAFSAYYRIGDSVTITPPAIDGYITPPTQTFVLGAADNDFSFVYGTEDEEETTVTPGDTNPDTADADTDGSLAETGMNLTLMIIISSLMIILGTIYLIRNNMKQQGMKL